MRLIKLLSITFLLACLIFGTMVACDGDDGNGDLGGETNCTDGIDNDGDTEIDCEDIDCILDPACTGPRCEDLGNTVCEKAEECFIAKTEAQFFEDCIMEFELDTNETTYCEFFEQSETAQNCLDEITEFDCFLFVFGDGPESCDPEGVCEPCETDADCAIGLRCAEFGTGTPILCSNEFFNTFCPIP